MARQKSVKQVPTRDLHDSMTRRLRRMEKYMTGGGGTVKQFESDIYKSEIAIEELLGREPENEQLQELARQAVHLRETYEIAIRGSR